MSIKKIIVEGHDGKTESVSFPDNNGSWISDEGFATCVKTLVWKIKGLIE